MLNCDRNKNKRKYLSEARALEEVKRLRQAKGGGHGSECLTAYYDMDEQGWFVGHKPRRRRNLSPATALRDAEPEPEPETGSEPTAELVLKVTRNGLVVTVGGWKLAERADAIGLTMTSGGVVLTADGVTVTTLETIKSTRN